MKTQIKNKQTGETLTGVIRPYGGADYINIKIGGTTHGTSFLKTEWEILPPPLPTGIGAVVNAGARMFVRVHSRGLDAWQRANIGGARYSDDEVSAHGAVAILSEGVTL